MKVRYDEGLASHIALESCACHREVSGEGLTEVRAGQPLSRERKTWFRAPTPYPWRKATRAGALSRVPDRPGVVRDPGMCRRSLHGNREVSRLAGGEAAPVRIGKVRSRSR